MLVCTKDVDSEKNSLPYPVGYFAWHSLIAALMAFVFVPASTLDPEEWIGAVLLVKREKERGKRESDLFTDHLATVLHPPRCLQELRQSLWCCTLAAQPRLEETARLPEIITCYVLPVPLHWSRSGSLTLVTGWINQNKTIFESTPGNFTDVAV